MTKVVTFWEQQYYKMAVPNECPTENLDEIEEWLVNKNIDKDLLRHKDERIDCDIINVRKDSQYDYLFDIFKCKWCGEKKFHAECSNKDVSICQACDKAWNGG